MKITDFLLARITEDESRANGRWEMKPDAMHHEAMHYPDRGEVVVRLDGETWNISVPEYQERFMAHAPDTRLLAECAAKRAIMERVSDVAWGGYAVRDVILGHLASVYANHKDYRPEWND